MRPGGGHAKGAAFEREICLKLSLWVSKQRRTDLFTRNVLSGGRFTLAVAKGEDHGTPGDTMASHPMAFGFASTFLIECKFHKDLNWDAFLYAREKSFLGRVIEQCRAQGKHAGLAYLVIAKQNQREPVVLMDNIPGMLGLIPKAWRVFSHTFHGGDIFCITLHDLVTFMKADEFVAHVRRKRVPSP